MTKFELTTVILGVLICASLFNLAWSLFSKEENAKKLQHEIDLRTKSWWVMSAFFLAALWWGFLPTLVLFLFLSFLALREYVTLIETKREDHRALIWSFLIITPLQYYFIGINWYGVFSIFVPVYGFLIVMTRVAFSGNCTDFLSRVATIHWGLMACVFLLSHAPAILTLPVIGFESNQYQLFFFLIVLTELSDVFQFIFGKIFGKTKIAPTVSPNKTVEGLIGGIIATGLAAALLNNLTPLSFYKDFLLGCAICLLGFCGGLTMSAVKRDKGCKDFGTLIAGHGGVLDRIDSLCFTAPLFFHYLRYFHTL